MKEGVNTLLQSNIFALTFDIGHDYCIGNKDIIFINENISKLKHMHIHDAIGGKNHLPLGKGEIDVNGKLNLAKEYSCRCVLETKTIVG